MKIKIEFMSSLCKILSFLIRREGALFNGTPLLNIMGCVVEFMRHYHQRNCLSSGPRPEALPIWMKGTAKPCIVIHLSNHFISQISINSSSFFVQRC